MNKSKIKDVKNKRCKQCKDLFTPSKPLQAVCTVKCALERAKTQRQAKEKKEHRAAKEKLKSRGDYAREAQQAFNAYIRERDRELPCISCGRFHKGQYHAGHYRTVGANPELRYNENNVHKQCAPCNDHLHGNIVNYRLGLIQRIGLEKVELLEGKHEAKHYSIEDLKQIKATYKAKLKELNNGL